MRVSVVGPAGRARRARRRGRVRDGGAGPARGLRARLLPGRARRRGGGAVGRRVDSGASLRLRAAALAAPPDAGALVARAAAVWRALKTLVWHERLAASPTEVIHTVYEAVAPDELSYTISGLSAAVIIGGARWDRPTPGGAGSRASEPAGPIQPLPFWFSVADARVLGIGAVSRGSASGTCRFFDPTTPAWFEAQIDKRTDRTLELSMIAASHFMHHVYGPFDAPARLQPPASG